MHWTATLRDQEIPPQARVAVDLACESCGYNLRTLSVHGQCPECGTDVLVTLRAQTSPVGKGEAYRRLGQAVLCLLGAVPALAPDVFGGMIGVAILGFGAIRGVRASAEIWRAVLHADLLLAAYAIQFVLACMTMVAVLFELDGGWPDVRWWLLAACALDGAIIMLLASLICRRIGQRTEYVIIVRESKSLILLTATILTLCVLTLVAASFGVPELGAILIVMGGFIWLCCVVLAATTLFHVANAVEKERMSMAHLIEHEDSNGREK